MQTVTVGTPHDNTLGLLLRLGSWLYHTQDRVVPYSRAANKQDTPPWRNTLWRRTFKSRLGCAKVRNHERRQTRHKTHPSRSSDQHLQHTPQLTHGHQQTAQDLTPRGRAHRFWRPPLSPPPPQWPHHSAHQRPRPQERRRRRTGRARSPQEAHPCGEVGWHCAARWSWWRESDRYRSSTVCCADGEHGSGRGGEEQRR